MFRALIIALVCTAPGLAQESEGGVVTGTVVDDISRAPISGAHVALGKVSGLRLQISATSDFDGKFLLTRVNAGQYWIECSSVGYVKLDGYTLDGPRVDVPAGGNAEPVTVRLAPAASIEGRLVSDDGEPIPGAKVQTYPSRATESTTDEDGRFRVDGLAPGEYKLRARLEDSIRRERMTVDPATRQRLGLPQIAFYPDAREASLAAPIFATPGAELRGLEFRVGRLPLVSVSGVVIDPRSGGPLEDGEIELRPAGRWVFGDGIPRHPLRQGRFRFDLLSAGSYQAHVYRPTASGTTESVTTIEAGGSDVTDLKVVLPSGGRLSGRVTLPENSGVTHVSLSPVGAWSRSEAKIKPDGSFTFEGLAPGKWLLGWGGGPSSVPITVGSIRQAGRLLEHSIDVVEGENDPLDVEITEMFWVTGTVIDRAGKPVEKASVAFLDGIQRFNLSGWGGNFEIGLRAGEYRVSAWMKMPSGEPATCKTTQVVRVTRNLTGLRVILCP